MIYISYLNIRSMNEVKVSKENILKQVGAYLPLLSIIVITLGLIKQVLYYFNYNVPIKYFLGLSELGIIISYEILVVLLASIFVIILHSKESETISLTNKGLTIFRIIYILLIIGILIILCICCTCKNIWIKRLTDNSLNVI